MRKRRYQQIAMLIIAIVTAALLAAVRPREVLNCDKSFPTVEPWESAIFAREHSQDMVKLSMNMLVQWITPTQAEMPARLGSEIEPE